ncbi:uncharacterized protein LOC128605714 isoform X2 [Ictalurus furcatus]|uniref:uncharacterized protein LOC128605714 isoform X2 n=1 Tax=Ictalurus furcatus TaxID=66913 RepID=UPI002350D2D4|nr:uncharacterized protein LOC128605714 isoform X2 [Ictalurus furcatus]
MWACADVVPEWLRDFSPCMTEDGGNQSSEGSERDRWRGELCNGGRLLPVPAGVTRRSEEERETERGRGRESMRNRERESERERATAKASQSLEPQADGRLSSWRGASRAQTGWLNPEGFHFLQPESPKESSRHVERISAGHLHTSRRTGPVPVGHLCPGSVGEGLGSLCQDFGGWGAPGTNTRPLSVHLRQAAHSHCQCGKPLRPTLCLFHSHSLPI